MKKLILGVIVLFAMHSNAQNQMYNQNGNYYSYFEKAVFDNEERAKYKEANIKTESRIRVSEKKGDILVLKQQFSENGALTAVKKKKYNKNKYNSIEYKYNTEGQGNP